MGEIETAGGGWREREGGRTLERGRDTKMRDKDKQIDKPTDR